MDLLLDSEQALVREAAASALARLPTLAEARAALDGAPAPDAWQTAVAAGWPGALTDGVDRHESGLLDAMLICEQAGRALASTGLVGQLPASQLLGLAESSEAARAASGECRVALVAARPPDNPGDVWRNDGTGVVTETPPPAIFTRRDGGATVTGSVEWVPDAGYAELLVIVCQQDSRPLAALVDARSRQVSIQDQTRFDMTFRAASVGLSSAPAQVLALDPRQLSDAWFVQQALVGAQALGAADRSREMATNYAKERYAFARPIGSFQAIKHTLVEMLRRCENARSLMLAVGCARRERFPLLASALRVVAEDALAFSATEGMAVHGAAGVTWEHDAHLFYRRSQVSRRLLGGDTGAAERVAAELLTMDDA